MSGLVVALVPAYNEEHYVASVLVRLREYVDRVIVCDDGSVDLTGDIAEAMGAVMVGMTGCLALGVTLFSLLGCRCFTLGSFFGWGSTRRTG